MWCLKISYHFLYIHNKIFKCFCRSLVPKLLNIRTKVIQRDESKIYFVLMNEVLII